MQLFHDRVLVKTIPPSQETKGGIVLPATSKPKYHKSTVVLVGTGQPAASHLATTLPTPLNLKPGDVVYHFSAGVEFELGNQSLRMLTEAELIGKD